MLMWTCYLLYINKDQTSQHQELCALLFANTVWAL